MHAHGKRIVAFLSKFLYGQLQDGAKAKKPIAKSLDTLCGRILLRYQQTQEEHATILVELTESLNQVDLRV
jgi:hypothetical protein